MLLGASGSSPVDRERCRREIAALEALICAGHPDLQGLCLALSDWSKELRLIEQEMRMALKAEMPATAEAGRADGPEAGSYFGIE
jgi:hypothetical protein